MILATPGYLMDHHFQGKPVLPAVEAMEALTRIVRETYPQMRVDHLIDAGFEKFLFLSPHADQLDAIAKLETLEGGRLQATLLTRTQSPKAAFTRTKTHVRLTFDPSPPPQHHLPQDTAAALKGACTIVPPEKIYQELVPFGPTFRNIQAPLYISPDGAMARIQTPRKAYHSLNETNLLGSGYALDAAFHAACVWAQHFKSIVAFPVAVDRRTLVHPTRPETTYFGRIIPKSISDVLLIFDIFLLDKNGLVCETAEGVRMRDVSGGRLQPPDWICCNMQPDPFKHFKKKIRDMAIVELDAVAGFAHKTLAPLETQRYEIMGSQRRKSFLAARMALKNLYRRGRNDDDTTPADRIETVCKNSPLPCAGPAGSCIEKYCSVSHDQRFAIGVVDSRAVGVDVEVISPKALKADRIFMNADEQKLVKQSTMEDTSAAVRIWSVKEAVAKAMGMNLADAWTRVQVTAVGDLTSEWNVDGKAFTAQHATVDNHLFTLASIC
jgi:phosphopantetheinyl transferase (holo-ACP synthase)